MLLCSNGPMTTASLWLWRSPTCRTTSSPVTSWMRWYGLSSSDSAAKSSRNVFQTCFLMCFFVLFCLFADVAGWFLQGSSRPRPLHPLLVPWYHHAGQDQGRTTNAGLYVHIYIYVCLCVYSQYNDVAAANQVAASPNCIVDVKVAGVSSPILENWSSVGAFRRMCHLN